MVYTPGSDWVYYNVPRTDIDLSVKESTKLTVNLVNEQ